jgi:hypothetical protein
MFIAQVTPWEHNNLPIIYTVTRLDIRVDAGRRCLLSARRFLFNDAIPSALRRRNYNTIPNNDTCRSESTSLYSNTFLCKKC